MSYKYENKGDYGYADDDASYMSDTKMSKKMKKELAELNKQDKGYYEVKRSPYSYPGGKLKTIGIFGSGDVGSSIRDAITGVRNYAHKVGSVSEDLYFKARICTGELGPDNPSLFFDSPEQYERHMFAKLDDEVKMRWHKKNLAARRALGDDEPRNLKILASGQQVTVVK
jgi:hypothetical protein